MRILQSITYYLPYISGITIYAQRLGKELIKRGYQVKVVTSRYTPRIKKRERMDGINIYRVPAVFSVSKGPIMPRWPFAAWENISGADIVFVHLPQFEGAITAFMAKLQRKPLIAVYHCEVTLTVGLFNSLVGKVLDVSQWVNCWLADKIIVYTDDYAKYSRVASRFLEKTEQIYPPVILEKKRKQLKIKKKKGEIWIGFLGRIAAEKGLEYLLEALQFLKAHQGELLQLVIAGPEPIGEEGYVNKIKKLVEKGESDIVFLGNLGQDELVEFYKSIDVLALPSVNSTEAFGLVQVEAMLCGTPVVATDLPGVRVPIRETGMGEIVPPRDSKALANAIMKVVHNKKLYTKPKQKILDLFNIDETIAKYVDLFNRLKS